MMKPHALIPIVVAALILLPAPISAQSLDDEVARVEQLAAQKQTQEALGLAKRLVAEHPASSDAWRAQARARRAMGDANGAVADYSKAIALNPRNVHAYNGRALAYDALRRREEALRDIGKALEIDPRFPNAYDTRAMIKIHAGDLAGALEDCNHAITLAPTLGSALGHRAEILFRQNDYDGVIRDASAALARSPDMLLVVAERGYAYVQLKRYREAVTDYTRCIDANYDAANAYNGRAYAHRMLGELSEALADAKRSAELAPNDGAANRNLHEIQTLLASAPTVSPTRAVGSQSAQGMPPSAAAPPQASKLGVAAVRFSAGDPCAAAKTPAAGVPWQTPSARAAKSAPAVEIVLLPAPLDLQTMTRAQYAGAVSAAFEEMRLVYGPMSPENSKALESLWAPLFSYPSSAVVTYLNALNPLIAQFLAGREAMTRAAAAYEGALLDASLAVTASSRAGWQDGMASASRQAAVMQALDGGLAELARRIEALGNPPNPLEAKCGARRRHQQAVAALGAPAEEVAPAGEVFSSNLVTIALADGHTWWAPRPGGLPPEGVPLIWEGRSFYGEERRRVQKPETLYTDQDRMNRANGHYIEIEKRVAWVRGTLSADGMRAERLEGGWDLEGSPPVVHVSVAEVPFDTGEWRAGQAVGEAHQFPYTKRFPAGYGPAEVTYSGPFSQNWTNIGTERKSYLKVIFDHKPNLPAAQHGTLPPADGSAGTPASSKATADAASSAAAEQEQRETIAFHQANIAFLERTLRNEQDELSKETNAERHRALSFLVVQVQSDIQAEKDLVASYQTGQIVHTRSAFDEFAQQKFIRGMQEEAARVDATRRIAAGIEREIELLPEEQRAAMREKTASLLDAKTIASGDVEKARRLAGALDNQVQGYWQGQAAREEEKALAAQEHEFYTQLGVMAFGMGTVGLGSAALANTFGETAALTVWGPHLIGGVYGGVTGAIAGGPVEGVKECVAWSSTLGYMATQFVEGYQGASDPKASASDRAWEGVKQAGTAFLLGKAFEFGTTIVNKGALAYFGADSQLFKPVVGWAPTASQQFDAAHTRQQIEDARSLISLYQDKELRLAQLRSSASAPSPEARKLDDELASLAASINSSYHCKWLMKYEAHPLVRAKFGARVERSYDEMMPEMIDDLRAQKYDMEGIEFKPVRNASSAGSSSMDLDLALKERPNMAFTKDGRQVSLYQFMVDAQKAMNRAYHKVTGFSATRSELNLTTSLHPEAFTDMGLLKKDVDFSTIGGEDIANIGKVLQVKVAKIEGDPVLSAIGKAQASCRESAKELENMLLPNLRQQLQKAPNSAEVAKLQAAIEHFESIQKTFKRIGTKETDPYEIIRLERELREETGGLGIQETIGEISRRFEKLGSRGAQ